MSAGGERGRVGQAVVDAQVIEVLVVFNIVVGQGRRALGPLAAAVALLIVVDEVDHVAGEAPGGAGIHIAGGERVKAEGGGVGVDVLGDGLETLKVLQLVHAVAGLLDQVGVDDDAVALEAVADGDQLAVLIVEVVGVGVQLVGDGGARQVEGIVAPVADGVGVADDVQRRGIALIHLGGQGLAVGAGSGGDDLDVDALLFLVQLGDLLERVVGLRLEVQPVDRAGLAAGGGRRGALGAGAGRRGFGLAAAGNESQGHDHCENKCKNLFHDKSPHFIDLYKRRAPSISLGWMRRGADASAA